MHIAQIAPLTEAVPPKLYGGTERVIHWLTDEVVALGPSTTPDRLQASLLTGAQRSSPAVCFAPSALQVGTQI
jgi:hypothetical protein